MASSEHDDKSVKPLLPVPSSFPLSRARLPVRSKRVLLIALLSGISLIRGGLHLLSYSVSGILEKSLSTFLGPSDNTPSTPKVLARKAIVVLPVSSTNPQFCMTLFSLLINGYDPPIIINWGETVTDPFHHYYKVKGSLSYLDSRNGTPSDTIMMLDGHDVWAQLPASHMYEMHASYPYRFQPAVISGVEKNCWPFSYWEPPCADLPESPLPHDVYGDATDKRHKNLDQGDSDPAASQTTVYKYDILDTIRPKFLNSGTLIGSSSDLLNLFKNMSAKLELVEQGKLKPKSRGSDQELMVRVNYDSMQSGNSNVVVGDDQMMLFQVTTFSYKDLVFQNLSETIQDTKEPQKSILNDLIKEDNHLVGRSIIYNFRSQTIPPMIHFPGHPKPLKKWWKLMWWMRPQYTILRNGNTTNTTRSVVIQNAKSPAEVFYEKLEKHPEEPYGYGARLANGQWMSYMDLCRPFVRDILEV